MTDLTLATTFNTFNLSNSTILHPIVLAEDTDWNDWIGKDGLWNGTTTGDADLDYQLLKHNEEILGEDDPRIIEEKDEIETPIERIEDEVMEKVDKIPFGPQIHKFLTYMYYFRWIINLWIDAIPWTIATLVLLGFNIYLNIAWNRWWAGGNIFLILGTAYHVIMGFHSIMLVYEFPPFLRWTKWWRQIAEGIAWSTTLIYIIFIIKWVIMLYASSDSEEEQWDFVSVFENMFLGYNIILNIPILPINFKIIVKEITINFIQLMSPNAGHSNDDESINSVDQISFLNLFNPYSYFDALWRIIFKWDFDDILKKNKNDEDKYW